EAHRDVKKAYVRAAEVALKASEIPAANAERLFANKVIGKDEVEKAKLEVEAAKAQLDIRMAEMKEVEVKVKVAKKRLEDAKAGGVRPLPKVDTKPVDPIVPPPAPPAPEDEKAKQLAELKAKLEKLTAESEKQTATVKKAEDEAKVAQAELDKILDIAKR